MDAVTFQSEVLKIERLLYHVAYTALGNRQECADAVQEAILRGWTKRGQLRDPKLIRPWLARITVNECRNLQRRSMKQLRAVNAAIDEMRAAHSARGPNEE